MIFRPALAGLAICIAVNPLAAQDFTLRPTFGVISVTSGFLPDPNWIGILSGGSIRSEHTDQRTGSTCAGWFADAPDLRVHFTPDTGLPLSFYVDSGADTVLLINTPDGQFHCNDDSSGLNPSLTFEDAQPGQYDIWVGTYADLGDEYPPAELAITEAEPFVGVYERAFFGEDDRVEVDFSSPPWSMIGYLDSGPSSCTGVLIGPQTVLTAAHCLASNGRVDTPPAEFLAGYNGGRSVASSRATGYHVPAQWLAGEQDGYDFAFVYLADPIGDLTGWMDVTGLSDAEVEALHNGRGPEIMQAGYSYDRDGIMTGNLDCTFVELGPSSTIVHECDTLQGDSGSPLFIEDGGRYRIIGIESYTDVQPSQTYDRNVANYTDTIMAEMFGLANGTIRGPVAETK